MDNNEKLAFLVALEKKQKRKRIMMLVAVLVIFGGLMIFFQVMNYQSIE